MKHIYDFVSKDYMVIYLKALIIMPHIALLVYLLRHIRHNYFSQHQATPRAAKILAFVFPIHFVRLDLLLLKLKIENQSLRPFSMSLLKDFKLKLITLRRVHVEVKLGQSIMPII